MPFARLLMLLAVLAGVTGLGSSARAAVRPGQPAPGLIAPDLQGHVFDLAEARGHVVVVSLWATWCAPCRAEMPILNAAYLRHHGEGLDVIGLSLDRPKDEEEVRRAMQAFSYPSGLAARARLNGFGAPRALPQTFVIDRGGTVRAVFGVLGAPVTEGAIEAAIQPLLAQ